MGSRSDAFPLAPFAIQVLSDKSCHIPILLNLLLRLCSGHRVRVLRAGGARPPQRRGALDILVAKDQWRGSNLILQFPGVIIFSARAYSPVGVQGLEDIRNGACRVRRAHLFYN